MACAFLGVFYSHLALNEPSTWGQAEAMLDRFERARGGAAELSQDAATVG